MSKKSMIITGLAIIGTLIAIIFVVWIISKYRKVYYSYEQVEEKMKAATVSYYNTYPDMLPVEDGQYNLSYSALVEGDFIKPLNELLSNGDECSANVNVYKTDGKYYYVPRLNCGTYYRTTELHDRIIETNIVQTTLSGLHKSENGTYYYSGKVDNNYVALGTKGTDKKKTDLLWRILSIDTDGNIRIMLNSPLKIKTAYDDRYNEDIKKIYGYNSFEDSALKDFLMQLDTKEDYRLLTDEEKSILVKLPLCYGTREVNDISIDGSTECAKTSEPMLFGTITPYEFIRSSLDENCKNMEDNSCMNFNFLAEDSYSQWVITATKKNNYQAYVLNGYTFELVNANKTYPIYPVINISSRALYKTGDGTIDNPYRIFDAPTRK